MSKRLALLLVGDTSTPEALGSKFVRGAHAAGLDKERDLVVAYSSPAQTYSPSMKHLRGKLFYRLADRRSWEWWGFQKQLKFLVELHRPLLVLVTGIMPLAPEVFQCVHRNGGRIVNYLTDDPWNPIHRRRCFVRSLQNYDHIFSTKQALRERLEAAGAASTSWLPFAYDPLLHHPPQRQNRDGADVVFVGTGAKERLPWLQAVAEIPGISRRIHGNNWNGLQTPGWSQAGAVVGESYCEALSSARVVLGLLRQANGDLSTDRSYEIGAIGACGLYKDSIEHRQLLTDYPEEGFFTTPEELKKKVEQILDKPDLQAQLRQKGAAALSSTQHTYGARLLEILNWGGMQA